MVTWNEETIAISCISDGIRAAPGRTTTTPERIASAIDIHRVINIAIMHRATCAIMQGISMTTDARIDTGERALPGIEKCQGQSPGRGVATRIMTVRTSPRGKGRAFIMNSW